MFNNTFALNANNAGYNFTSYNSTHNQTTLGVKIPSSTALKGQMSSKRSRVPKNAGKVVQKKLMENEARNINEARVVAKRSASKKLPIINFQNIDPDPNGCADINYKVGSKTGTFDFYHKYNTLQDLQTCATKGAIAKYECNKNPGWFQSRYCKAVQTENKIDNKCDEINLQAGEQGRYNTMEDLINCMPKNGDTYRANGYPKIGCLFAKDLRNKDGNNLGSGLYCKTTSTTAMPFRVGGELMRGVDFFVPFQKTTSLSR